MFRALLSSPLCSMPQGGTVAGQGPSTELGGAQSACRGGSQLEEAFSDGVLSLISLVSVSLLLLNFLTPCFSAAVEGTPEPPNILWL